MREFASTHTALVPPSGLPMPGTLMVYADELVFSSHDGRPILTIPRDAIYAISSERKFLNKGRMRIRTVSGDFLFNDGYREVRALLNGVAAAPTPATA